MLQALCTLVTAIDTTGLSVSLLYGDEKDPYAFDCSGIFFTSPPASEKVCVGHDCLLTEHGRFAQIDGESASVLVKSVALDRDAVMSIAFVELIQAQYILPGTSANPLSWTLSWRFNSFCGSFMVPVRTALLRQCAA